MNATRMSMLHSPEVRVPLLDDDVSAMTFEMPTSTKVRGGLLKSSNRSGRDLGGYEVRSALVLEFWFREGVYSRVAVAALAAGGR